MLNGPPVRPTVGEQRVDDVADVDEVAALVAVAEDHRLLAARHALEEDRDDAALEPGVLPRPVDVREAQRRRASVPWIRFQPGEVLLAALLGDPVRRQRQERRGLGRRLGALAVAGAAGRGEDHLRARRGGAAR